MINYADYSFYKDTYKGAVIDTASFERYARNATAYIKMLTFSRIDDSNINDEVKMCCCEVAEKNCEADKSRHVGIASEKVGDYSVSYESNANIDMKLAKDRNVVVQKWLSMTGLLYRGDMLMYTNADCTVYFSRDGHFIRQVITDIFWSDSKQSNVLKTGLASADSVKVMIPIASADNLIFTTGKDLMIKGVIDYEFDNTSQKTVSESSAMLSKNYKAYTISSADDKRYGSPNMHHYDLSCK